MTKMKANEIFVAENVTLEDFLKGLSKNLDDNTAIIQEEIKLLNDKLKLAEEELKRLTGERKIEIIK